MFLTFPFLLKGKRGEKGSEGKNKEGEKGEGGREKSRILF